MFEDVFDKIFKKYVQTDTFRLPMCVKELRLFTQKICQSLLEDLSNNQSGTVSQITTKSSSWSSSTGSSKLRSISLSPSKSPKLTSPSKNAPIGLNSLSKTFNIIKIVGQGNFGRVFKLENKFDHRLFALKQILITPREDLKKVLQEVENLSRAGKHKNIVKYLDCFLIQEESGEIDIKEDTEFPSSDFTDERRNYDQTDSVSFINFQDDASDIRQIILSDADRDLEVKSPKRRKSLSVAEIDRPDSAGYSRTITCICIKMEFCDFTLDHLMTTMKTNRSKFMSAQDLFANAHLLVGEFKEDKINAKFGVFSPLFILKQLLEGLSFIHKLDIVHRDLKPANIFVMNNGNVKIGDFGLSKDLSKESGMSKLYAAGTRFYMAPEFANCHQNYDGGPEEEVVFPPADMYSLGMVLLKMLGFLETSDSEMMRLGDRIRKNFKREIGTFLKQSFIEDLAIGTTQGNLSPMRRRIYLPLLTTFLEDILTSVLDPRPRNRLSAARGQQLVGDIFNEIFCGNDFFRPKIGAK